MQRQPLTKQQAAILGFITSSIAANGYAPSLQEIGAAFGLRSQATVHKHLCNLAWKGYIKRAWNRSRALELIPPPECCPTCGKPIAA